LGRGGPEGQAFALVTTLAFDIVADFGSGLAALFATYD
jgi:hypothetical protein